ncbi:MAG: UUP1 family membrane protein [Halofilum sp. (in: g-proteobacteria)]
MLAAIGLGVAAWKHVSFGFPLTPDPETAVWTVEARARLQADGGPMRVEIPVPDQLHGYKIIEEDFISATFGAVPDDSGETRRVVWTARAPGSAPVLYYRMQLAESGERGDPPQSPAPTYPDPPEYDESLGAAITSLLEEVRQKSADVGSFARQLVLHYARNETDDRIQLLEGRTDSAHEHVEQLAYVLADARIPARTVWTLELAEGLRNGRLEPWLQVYTGARWRVIDPVTGDMGLPHDRLLWAVDDGAGVRVYGGELEGWQIAATRTQRDVLTVASQRAAEAGSRVVDLSLISLPVQSQQLFRLLLVLPVGALIVVLMRNVVGVQTFGTFMPVLIAFAFRETQLWLGMALFCATVALALVIRFYLERLRLLLVPRLAAVLTVIVALMAVISVASHHLGVDRALSVGLFPIIVLAMTVERMSVVWEESGPADALKQGVGSLIVAVMAYGVMTRPWLQHVMFIYPEMLLVVFALALLFGRYTGYRLFELWRFRSVLRQDPSR